MNTSEFFKIAKYVQFPKADNTYKDYGLTCCITKFPLTENQRYTGFCQNEHHYTTKYHIDYVLPSLAKVLSFDFNKNDFKKIENIITENGKSFDLSYLRPVKDMKFNVKCFNPSVQYDCGFDGLLYNEKVKGITWVTEYHKLYALPHNCSRIKNDSVKNGRKLLISGDSQMIPSIPVLSCYFEEVWYFDNRSDKSFKDILEKEKFTDILVALYAGGSIERYTNNFK